LYSLWFIAFNNDGNKLAGGGDREIITIWNLINGEEIISLKGHTKGVAKVLISKDGKKLVSGSHDKTLKVWNL